MEVHALSRCQPNWILAILDTYQQDAQAKELLQCLAIASEPDDVFSLRDGLIRQKGRIWLPPDCSLSA
jgi:hypothetical protein